MSHSKLCSIILVCGFVLSYAATHATAQENCDFRKLKARYVAHFVERTAINKVVPTYPDAAKAKGIGGEVPLAILVNKEGQVERACLRAPARAKPPDSSLVTAARLAALQWTFPRNFGFPENQQVHFDYIKGILIFQFVSDGSDKKVVVR
jgi:TonB family protein